MTDLLLRQILKKPEASGRLTKWAIKLIEFDIQYKLRIAIKGQDVADFIAEVTPQADPLAELGTELTEQSTTACPESSLASIPWKPFVDGSSNFKASGAGVILETLDQT